jgi:hypothetical protein
LAGATASAASVTVSVFASCSEKAGCHSIRLEPWQFPEAPRHGGLPKIRKSMGKLPGFRRPGQFLAQKTPKLIWWTGNLPAQ